MECRFPLAKADRVIAPHSVGYDDGMCKVLIMLSIVGFIRELELDMAKDDGSLQLVLSSFKSIRCSYTYYKNPAQHFLHSLSNLSSNSVILIFNVIHSEIFYIFTWCSGLKIFHLSGTLYLRNGLGDCREASAVSNQPDGGCEVSH